MTTTDGTTWAWADRLHALAEAIDRVAAAPTVGAFAAQLSVDAARLAGSAGAVLVTLDVHGMATSGAVDGSTAGDPAALLDALRNGEAVRPYLSAGRTTETPAMGRARRVAGVVPLRGDGRIVGLLAILEDEGDGGLDRDRWALVDVLAAVGGSLLARPLPGWPAPREARAGPDILEHDARAERRRIARELHDGLIQSLYGTGLLIGAQAQRTDLPERGRQTMQGWVERIDRLVQEARTYVGELEEAGDAVAELGAGLDAIAEAAAAAGLDVSTEMSATEQARVDEDIRRELLQVAREAVSNAVRHAHARRLVIRVEVDPPSDAVVLTVEDDGIGFEPAVRSAGGCGLRNMAARATALGGNLDIVSRPGAGTRIRLRVGLQGAPRTSS